MIFFSVIIPVYNVAEYLEESVKSVLRQSYTGFELILVDDGSTDASPELAKKLALEDQRITVFHKTSGGASSARNAGLMLAKGTHIYFMDSDDFIASNTLEILAEILSDESVDLAAFTATPFLDNNFNGNLDLISSENFYQRLFLKEGFYSGSSFYEAMSRKDNFVASVCLYAVKRDLIENHQIRFAEGIMMEDELFSRTLFLSCSKIYFLKTSFYQRRIRSGSVSTSSTDAKRIRSLCSVGAAIELLKNRFDHVMLSEDSKMFHQWALDGMQAMDKKSGDYRETLDYFLFHPLTEKYPVPEEILQQLKPGILKQLKNKMQQIKSRFGR